MNRPRALLLVATIGSFGVGCSSTERPSAPIDDSGAPSLDDADAGPLDTGTEAPGDIAEAVDGNGGDAGDRADSGDGGADSTDTAADASDADSDMGRPDPHGHPTFPPPDLGDWTAPAPVLTASASPPDALADLAAVHFGAVSCGPHPETVFDLLLPGDGNDTPYPLVVYIHGGGFTGGSRLGSFGGGAGAARSYVEAGMAYATIDYRFQDADGIRTSLQDSQVCLQFIRLHAATLGVDPDRIVLSGASAGAGTSLWLGTSDDLADPASSHPVLRQSTRVPGILLDKTQAHYDILDWRDDVFAPEYAEIFDVGVDAGLFDSSLRGVYGIPSGSDTVGLLREDPELVAFRATVSFLDHMDAEDAEIWAQTTDEDQVLVRELGTILHHPFHVRAILREARAVGLPIQANVPAIDESASEMRAQFAARILGL